jgi:hypothetical protein
LRVEGQGIVGKTERIMELGANSECEIPSVGVIQRKGLMKPS